MSIIIHEIEIKIKLCGRKKIIIIAKCIHFRHLKNSMIEGGVTGNTTDPIMIRNKK